MTQPPEILSMIFAGRTGTIAKMARKLCTGTKTRTIFLQYIYIYKSSSFEELHSVQQKYPKNCWITECPSCHEVRIATSPTTPATRWPKMAPAGFSARHGGYPIAGWFFDGKSYWKDMDDFVNLGSQGWLRKGSMALGAFLSHGE